MNKAELIDSVAARVGSDKKTASNIVEAALDTVTRAVAKGEKVAITGFGVFEKIDRPARMVRNPQTGERLRAKKTSVPKFRAGSQFKGVVSGAVKLARETTAAARNTAGTATKAAAKGVAAAKGTASKRTAAKRSTTKRSTTMRTTARPAAKSTAKTTAGRPAAKRATKTATKKTTTKAPARTTRKATTAKTTASARRTATKRTARKR